MARRSTRTLLALALPLALPLARAEGQPAASSAPAAITPVLALRVRPEAWDWFQAGSDDGRYAYVGVHARAGLAQQRARWGWRAELAAPAILGLPSDAVAPAPRGQLGLGGSYAAANDGETSPVHVFLKQAFLRAGAPPASGGHALRVGRMELADGAETAPASAAIATLKRDRVAQRLIGTFPFTHVGRSFDGGHYTFDRAGRNATVLAVRPTRGAFDVRGWDELDITVAYGALTLPVRTPRLAGEVRLFAARYDDDRRVVETDNRPLAERQGDPGDVGVTTVGGHWLESVPLVGGELDVLLWGAIQRGGWGRLSHRAGAAAIEAGWQPPPGFGALRPWLRAGWNRASGDERASDGRHGTFFPMLPTPRIYARFPFYTTMNLDDRFASLLLRPGTLSMRLDVRRLALAEGQDLWYTGGGAFERETFGFAGRPANGLRPLATLLDLSVDWRVRPRWTAAAYLARAAGGAVVERIYAGRSTAHFGYVELQYAR